MSEKTVAKYLGWAIVKRSTSPYLTIVGWHDGRRIKESAKSPMEQAARLLIRKRVREIAVRGKVTGPEVERTTYNDLEALFTADVTANRSASYLANATFRFVHLRKAFNHVLVRDVTHDRLNRYKASRIADGAAAATVQYELKLLRRMFTLGVKADRVDRIPPFPAVAVENARQGFASPAEVARLLEHLPEHVAPVVELLALTGMRSHEALELQWSRIDVEAQTIRLRAEDTKTRRARTIPYGTFRPLAELLARQRERVRAMEHESGSIIGAVFPDVSPVTFKRWWLKAAKAAGLPALRPHDLRRSAARNMTAAGLPEATVMKLCGWRTRAMFDRYSVVTGTDLQDGLGRLGRFLERSTAPHNAPQRKDAAGRAG